MAFEDQIKWDKRYQETSSLLKDRAPSKKLQNIINKVQGRKALEIACGTGRNSVFLAENGFTVEALDISSVALGFIETKNISNIHTKHIDLEGYEPNKNSYDLIVKTNYLDRAIIPNLLEALKKEGILFIETYMKHPSNTKPSSNPDFLLDQGELKSFCKEGFEILEYDEFDNEAFENYQMRKQYIVIRKI